MKKFQQVTERFEKAVTKLQENLQYLADQDKVSDRFLNIQNKIIKTLIDYQHEVMRTLKAYDQLAVKLSLKGSADYQQLLNDKQSLEAICIIHGIIDFTSWMNKGKSYLIQEAIYHYQHSEVQFSHSIMEMIRNMDPHDREQLWSLFNKQAHLRWEKALSEMKMKTYA
ncbi:hypothetical protein [Marinoscillum pacificum]|uniref:hypothetical protein n=1 Tax=Marinoscillum pacificum TaxID=392723 RepID=UPI002157CAF8|nr:hypothetical protein [Marinoscillum pacificum]